MGWTEVWRNSSFIAMSPSHHHQFYAFKIHTIVINRQQTELFREFLDTYLHDIIKWHSVQGSDTGSRASLPVFVPSNPETDRMLQHFSDSRKPQTVWWETLHQHRPVTPSRHASSIWELIGHSYSIAASLYWVTLDETFSFPLKYKTHVGVAIENHLSLLAKIIFYILTFDTLNILLEWCHFRS